MRAATIHGPKDIRVTSAPDPRVRSPEDAVVRVTHAGVCGSDLWAYRGVAAREPGQRIGHEFIGVVDEVGAAVRTLWRGDRVIAPFVWSDATCDQCAAGWYTSCAQMGFWGQPGADGGQGEAVRVPFADATLVRVDGPVDPTMMPALLSLADVMCTGHHGAVAAGAGPGAAVAVVGDGAVGLCAVLAARRLGAERIVVLGHHADRMVLAARLGATHVVDGEEATRAARDLTGGRGFDCVIEAVGTSASMREAMSVAADGGTVGYVGVPHGSESSVDLRELYYRNIAVRGGITPARAYLPELLADVLSGVLDPSPVFDLTIGLDEVPEGYAAMDERRAIKAIIHIGP